MERHRGVEQAIDGQAARPEIDAEIAGQEQVGLARLDGDAGGNAAAVQIPGAGPDVVLGDDAAGGQRARLAFDAQDAVDQHQRLVGQADARREGVDRGEVGAEHAADGADGEFQALRPVQRPRRGYRGVAGGVSPLIQNVSVTVEDRALTPSARPLIGVAERFQQSRLKRQSADQGVDARSRCNAGTRRAASPAHAASSRPPPASAPVRSEGTPA